MATVRSPRSMRGRHTPLALAAALLLLGAAPGCGKKSTAPQPQGRITGQVTYAGGGPAAGLDVSLASFGTSAVTLRIATTNAAGNFVFTGLEAGSYVAYCRDFASMADADTVVSTGAASETTTVNLALRPAGKVTGTVTLSGRTDHSGTIVNATVLLSLATTDSIGAFELPDIPPGQWVIEASQPGFATATAPVTIPAPGDSVHIAPFQLVPGTPAARLTGAALRARSGAR